MGIGIFLRRRAIASQPVITPILPGVEFYDKLKANNGAYIVIPSFHSESTDSCYFKFNATNLSNNGFVMGSRGSAFSVLYLRSDAKRAYISAYRPETFDVFNGSGLAAKQEVSFRHIGGKHEVTINGTTFPPTTDVINSITQPLVIFGSNSIGSTAIDSRLFDGEIYYLVIEDKDGRKKIDLKPCIYEGEVGMWDVVSNKFYGNSGTGTLSALNE